MSEAISVHEPQPEVAEVQIEKLVYGGDGLARLNGQVLLAPFVLPGERITVRPERAKGGLLRASQIELIEAASERVTPRCEYFFRCGGCQYQHAEYAFALRQKEAILRETMQRIGNLTFEGEIALISANPWSYRNRIQLHFEEGRLGFHEAGSNRLCAIDHCEISSPMLVETIGQLQSAVRDPKWPRFLRSLELFTNEKDLQLTVVDSTRPVAAKFFHWCAEFLPGMASGAIEYPAAGRVFRVSRGSFFQVNRFLIDQLVDAALGSNAGTTAVDLYAGIGLFSLPLAEHYQRVYAVERGGPAYRDLEYNAQSYSQILAAKSAAGDFLQTLSDTPDLVIADPPRSGLERDVVEGLLRLLPPALTLVSCDPATLSRDLKRLGAAYRIERMALVDLFPQTYHFETVAALRLR
jgi:23S rRNA (uracil1939-C5)-methyltransferase